MPYTITQSNWDSLTADGLTIDVNNGGAYSGMTINSGDYVALYSNGPVIDYAYFGGQDPNTGEFLQLNFTINGAGTSASAMMDGVNYYQLMYAVQAPQPTFTITQAMIDELALSGSTMTVGGVAATVGTEVYSGDEIVATVGDGFNFLIDGVKFSGQDPVTGEMLNLTLTTSDDFLTATATADDVSYYGLSVGVEQVDTVSGTNNVYLITPAKLSEVNAQRNVGTPPDVYDYGQFILSVIELPFEIDSELVLDPENVRLATFETDVSANKISTDKIMVDLGTISVPAIEGNLLDYKNVECVIHLPRLEPIVIANDYVIGETVSVQYIIDCYSGNATVNIISSKVGSVIITKTVDIGISIPFAATNGEATITNNSIEVGGDNGVSVPFIEVLTNEAVLSDGLFTNPIIDESQLSGNTGFIQVEQIDLNLKATHDEKQKLISELQNGVIIK